MSSDYSRPAWTPVTESVDGPLTGSKFAGTPWLAEGEAWPVCKGCLQPLQFFFQLNLEELPSELRGRYGPGLLQLFYCLGNNFCDAEINGWEEFADCEVVRIVQSRQVASPPAFPEGYRPFPPKSIVDWSRIEDLPAFDEQVDYEGPEDQCADGDKLAGWPCWLQFREYPSCPRCNSEMTNLIFQLESEDHLPYMFGDAGRGHITQCPEHKDVVAFRWACC